jgi:hypothetical protein
MSDTKKDSDQNSKNTEQDTGTFFKRRKKSDAELQEEAYLADEYYDINQWDEER